MKRMLLLLAPAILLVAITDSVATTTQKYTTGWPTGSVAAKNYASVLYARLTPEMRSRSAEGGIAFVPVQKYEIRCLFAIIRRQIPIEGCFPPE